MQSKNMNTTSLKRSKIDELEERLMFDLLDNKLILALRHVTLHQREITEEEVIYREKLRK